jgi:hypothetical protein
MNIFARHAFDTVSFAEVAAFAFVRFSHVQV